MNAEQEYHLLVAKGIIIALTLLVLLILQFL